MLPASVVSCGQHLCVQELGPGVMLAITQRSSREMLASSCDSMFCCHFGLQPACFHPARGDWCL